MQILNARIWRSEGVIENGYIDISGSRIAAFGPMEECPRPKPEDTVMDAGGCTIYPGFIDGHCHMGLIGDGLGFEGEDVNEETDPCTPHLRALDAINVMDRGFSEAAAAGITTVITGPGSANAIAGQFCAVKTHGRCIDEMVVKAPVAMKMAFGENPKTVYNNRSQSPTTRMATAAIIREQLFKARKYMQDLERAAEDEDFDEPEFDIKCEAMLPVLRRELKVHIHAHRADDICTALRICREFDLDCVLVHCTEGHLIADLLGEQGVQAVCGPIIGHRSKPELSNATLANAAALDAHGVQVAICTDHPEVPVEFLPISAGLCVREGLPFDRAIEGLTCIPARQSGIEDRVGSIAVGLDADLVAFDQNPLSVEAKPRLVMINGKILHSSL